MKTFLKEDHLHSSWVLIVISMIICIILPFLPITNDVSSPMLLIWMSLIIAATVLGVRFIDSIGLYIDHETIYYKSLSKKEIDPNKIIAIRVTTSIFRGEYSLATEMTDADGNKLLSMFFLNGFDPGMQSQADCDKDSYFMSEYKKFIICHCVYDQAVIDYLLTLNPNIIVF